MNGKASDESRHWIYVVTALLIRLIIFKHIRSLHMNDVDIFPTLLLVLVHDVNSNFTSG